MAFLVFVWFAGSLALLVVPAALRMPDLAVYVGGGFGLTGLVTGGAAAVYAKLYTKTSASEAFYVTGQGKPKVIIDGGCMVVPLIHDMTRVLLQTMKLEVVRRGQEALICKDFLRVDVSAEFYIRVNKTEEGIKAAATTLGRDAMNPESVKTRLVEKLVSALRTVAATMDLNELHQNREKFALGVVQAVSKDIDTNGMFLETVTISQLDQTDTKNLKADNVFDAQGLRKATEITQRELIQKNKAEQLAKAAIQEENVTADKRVLELQKQRSFAEADQKAEVQNNAKKREREIAEFASAQQEEMEKRAVQKDQAVKAAEIQRETALVLEKQKRETAEVQKQQAVEVALRNQRIAVAQSEAMRADAEAKQRLAEAKEREAAEKVVTAAQVEVARREKEKALIKADQDGQQQLIGEQRRADAEAYKMTRAAQAEQESAENGAKAKIRLAEADLEAKRNESQGLRAVQMVPVEVDAERVKVENQRVDVLRKELTAKGMVPVEVDSERVKVDAARVEVLRRELEAKQTYSASAIQLEIAKLQIDASKEVGVAMARSIGEFMQHGTFQMFGDPTALADMTRKFTDGLGLSQMLMGLKEGNPLMGKVVESGLAAVQSGLEAAKAKADQSVEKSAATSKKQPQA